jgi:ribonuclease HII
MPDFFYENQYEGLIAGCDEAGRGPLAGPVVAAACILDPLHVPQGLNDSKKLNETQREKLFEQLLTHHSLCIVALPASEIDAINIRLTSLKAMNLAVLGLATRPVLALVDGRDIIAFPSRAIIKGDSLSLSIAAASIAAKVTRDRIMVEMHNKYPAYGFAKHKGYGTKVHLEAIIKYGACPIHRLSFAPFTNNSR